MNINDRLDEMQQQIDDLQKWKSSCNMLMAGWGGVLHGGPHCRRINSHVLPKH